MRGQIAARTMIGQRWELYAKTSSLPLGARPPSLEVTSRLTTTLRLYLATEPSHKPAAAYPPSKHYCSLICRVQ
jgi:hypothetical protein